MADRAYSLDDTQYRAGTGQYLDALTAQWALHVARQTQVATLLTDLANRIALYRAIGADDSLGVNGS